MIGGIPGSGIPGRAVPGQISGDDGASGYALGQVLGVIITIAAGTATATAPGTVRFRGGALLAARHPHDGLALGRVLEIHTSIEPGVALIILPPMELLARSADGEEFTLRLEGFTAADLRDEALMRELLGEDAMLLDF